MADPFLVACAVSATWRPARSRPEVPKVCKEFCLTSGAWVGYTSSAFGRVPFRLT